MLNLQSLKNSSERQFVVPAAIAISLVVITVPYLMFQYSKPRKLKNGKYNTTTGLPKSTTAVPILGDAWEIGRKYPGRPLEYFDKECRAHNYQAWQFTIPGRSPIVVISSHKQFEEVFKNNHIFVRVVNEKEVEWLRDFFGRGLFISDGEEWAHQRKQASHLFTMANIKDAMQTVVHDKLMQVGNLLETCAKDPSKVISIGDIFSRYTADVFGHMGFGVDMKQLESFEQEEQMNDAIRAITESADLSRTRDTSFKTWWKLKRWLNVGTERKLRENLDLLNTLVRDIVEESLANKAVEAAAKERGETIKEDSKSDLISLFLSSSDRRPLAVNGDQTDQVTYIRDMVVNFIIAGYDTTSQTMSWVVVMLNRYPQVEKKLLEELRAKLPSKLWHHDSKGEYCGLNELPTMEQLAQLPYLEAVISETLRLCSPISLARRAAAQDYVFEDGLLVKKGWICFIAFDSMSRNPAVWGEDADLFKPDRWLTEDSPPKLKKFSPYVATAFGAGRRICLGQAFAMWQMKATLAFILSRFHFKTLENPWEVMYAVSLARRVKGPLNGKVSFVDV